MGIGIGRTLAITTLTSILFYMLDQYLGGVNYGNVVVQVPKLYEEVVNNATMAKEFVLNNKMAFGSMIVRRKSAMQMLLQVFWITNSKYVVATLVSVIFPGVGWGATALGFVLSPLLGTMYSKIMTQLLVLGPNAVMGTFITISSWILAASKLEVPYLLQLPKSVRHKQIYAAITAFLTGNLAINDMSQTQLELRQRASMVALERLYTPDARLAGAELNLQVQETALVRQEEQLAQQRLSAH